MPSAAAVGDMLVCNTSNASHIIVDRIELFITDWPQAEFGPAHIVVADLNLTDADVQWCLLLTRAALDPQGLRASLSMEDVHFLEEMRWYRDCDSNELHATLTLLQELLAMPERERYAVGPTD
jgi:hypothetical protein